MKAFLIALLCTLLGIAAAKAQTPQIYNCQMPGDYLVNEELCFTFDVAENLNVGFGPYLRIMLPPGVQLHSAVFGAGSTLMLVDTAAGTPLKDPYRNSGTIADSVSLPVGWTFWVLTYPVGSVSAGGVSLTTVMCFLMDPAQVTIGQPLNIQLQAGYIYGGTPTGATGPSLGPLWTGQITPELYYYKKSSGPLPRHDRTQALTGRSSTASPSILRMRKRSRILCFKTTCPTASCSCQAHSPTRLVAWQIPAASPQVCPAAISQ